MAGRPGWLLTAALLALSGPLRAEVVASGPGGFVIGQERELSAPPARVYQAIVDEVSAWWNPDHTYSGNAASLSIEATAGGCFCERLGDGAAVEHLRVVFAWPGRLLRLSGGLGPLQSMGATGSMDFALKETAGGGTTLQFRYSVAGFSPDGMAVMAAPVDAMLNEQLDRLTAHVAVGAP